MGGTTEAQPVVSSQRSKDGSGGLVILIVAALAVSVLVNLALLAWLAGSA